MNANKLHLSLIAALILALIASLAVGAGSPGPNTPLGTAFTYQGRLTDDAGLPVDDTCDLQFSLWDDPDAGSQIGPTLDVTGVAVTKGLFTAPLDFGAVFDGAALWLKIAVRCSGDPGYTDLSPRQALTATPYALNADLLDGKHAAAFLQHPSNVVIVAKSGGDYDTITAALDSITDASDTNRYLVKVMPGVYAERVTMKPYVDIEGSGELTTKITYMGSDQLLTGTLVGADNAEVRMLTVENTGGGEYATAIYNGSTSPVMTDMTITAAGGARSLGVRNDHSSPAMTDLAVTVSGGVGSCGVYNSTSSSAMTNVTVTVSVTVSGAGTYSIGVENQDSSTKMTNVTAIASEGFYSWGVVNVNSSTTMANVTATASGGTDTVGVDNTDSSPTMTNVTATASEGVHNYGVRNVRSSPTIQNSVIRASGGTDNYGIYSPFSPDSNTVTVNNSQVTGSTGTISCADGDTCRAGASLLDGGPVSEGVVCAGVYDESYTFYASTCP